MKAIECMWAGIMGKVRERRGVKGGNDVPIIFFKFKT